MDGLTGLKVFRYDMALRALVSFNNFSLAKRSKPERWVMIVAEFTIHPKFSC